MPEASTPCALRRLGTSQTLAAAPDARQGRIPARTASTKSDVEAAPPRSGVGRRRARRPRLPPGARPLRAVEAVREHERGRAEHGRRAWRCPGRRCLAPSRAPARRSRAPSPRLAEPASPSPPVLASAATSERMSPNVFSVRMTSKRRRDHELEVRSCRRACARARRRRTRCTRTTTSRQSREVSRTFALSTEVTCSCRARASSKPRRAMRSTWSGRYSIVSKTVPRRGRSARRSRGRPRARGRRAGRCRRPAPPQVRVDVELTA